MNEAMRRELDEASPLYWRVIRDAGAPEWTVACMQWFDEYDADQARYFDDVRYATEAEAEASARTANRANRVGVQRAYAAAAALIEAALADPDPRDRLREVERALAEIRRRCRPGLG